MKEMKHGPTTPVPVRVDSLTHARIRRAAKKLGSNTSAIIRFAIINQLPQIESGTIVLAPETREVA